MECSWNSSVVHKPTIKDRFVPGQRLNQLIEGFLSDLCKKTTLNTYKIHQKTSLPISVEIPLNFPETQILRGRPCNRAQNWVVMSEGEKRWAGGEFRNHHILTIIEITFFFQFQFVFVFFNYWIPLSIPIYIPRRQKCCWEWHRPAQIATPSTQTDTTA